MDASSLATLLALIITIIIAIILIATGHFLQGPLIIIITIICLFFIFMFLFIAFHLCVNHVKGISNNKVRTCP